MLQLVVSCQVMTDPCCHLAVIFCGFMLHQTGRETIKIPEIFFSDRVFMGKTVTSLFTNLYLAKTSEFLLTDATFAPRFP